MARVTRKRLGEILIEEGVLTPEQVIAALQEQRRTGELLGEALIRLGYASEEDIVSTLISQFGLPYLPVGRYSIEKELADLFPEKLLRQYQFIPVERMGNVLAVVAGNPLTPEILGELEQMTGYKILVYIGKPSEVKVVIGDKFARKEAAPKLSSLGSMLLGEE